MAPDLASCKIEPMNKECHMNDHVKGDEEESEMNPQPISVAEKQQEEIQGTRQHAATINVCDILSEESEFETCGKKPINHLFEFLSALGTLTKGGLGSGILLVPHTVKECGIGLSITMIAVTGLISFVCWLFLCQVIRFQEKVDKSPDNQNLTLETVTGKLIGPKSQLFIEIITYVYSFGTCVGYTIFIITTLQSLIKMNFVIEGGIFVIILSFSMCQKIEKFSVISCFCLFMLISSIGYIFYVSISLVDDKISNELMAVNFKWTGIFSTLGIYSFMFDVNGIITEVHASMKVKSQFPYVVGAYLIIASGISMMFGVFVYLGFGVNVKQNVFDNLDESQILVKILKVIFSLSLLCNILLFNFPVVKYLDKLLLGIYPGETMMFKWQLLIRALIIGAFVMMGKVLLSYFDTMFTILGSVFCLILTYFMPHLLLRFAQEKAIRLVKASNSKVFASAYKILTFRNCMISLIAILFGLAGGILGITDSIQSILNVQP